MPFITKSNKRYLKVEIILTINCKWTYEIDDSVK